MTPNTREPQAPESYATFWEPTAAHAPAPAERTASVPNADTTKDAKTDAYQEFVNVTEDVPAPQRAERD